MHTLQHYTFYMKSHKIKDIKYINDFFWKKFEKEGLRNCNQQIKEENTFQEINDYTVL